MNNGHLGVGRSVADGLRMSFGFALGAFTFGTVYGSAAHVQGMTDVQTLVLSLTAFAGAAQFAVLPFWNDPLPYLAIALSAGLVSSRNILMGLTLSPLLRSMSPLQRLTGIWLLVDASWALAMQERRRADVTTLYMTCSVTLLVAWMAGVSVGVSLPGALDPLTLKALGQGGMIFLFLILVMVTRSRIGPALPWVIAAAASVAAHRWLDPHYTLLIGVGAGAAAGMILPEKKHD
ncbi:MAG: branched-chain amino acid ABC transporter permease [Minwuia thermotolerans]|nr:MAG: branched-chain amino acid ABC transporter permease [Minwuia thermotolerans]